MVPGFDDAKTTEMRARLDDHLGLWAVTYLLFFVKLGPGLALFLVLVFAIWIGWRWLCRKCTAVAWAVWWHVTRRTAPPPNRAPSIHLLPLRGRGARLVRKSLGCG
jgi:hypothetical protein